MGTCTMGGGNVQIGMHAQFQEVLMRINRIGVQFVSAAAVKGRCSR